jgi:hypothetical protein
MKQLVLTLGLILCTVVAVFSQPYTFSVTTGTYADLEGSTSINDGMTWDDPQFEIPLGFDFQYFDKSIEKLFIEDWGLGALLSIDTNEAGLQTLLIPYGADLIDRSYDFLLGPDTGSLSNISYLTEGSPGNRITKIEWKNAGFYGDLALNGTSIDFINFQLWLYETTNAIEIHFGPKSITQPEEAFEGDTGSSIVLIPEYDFDDDIFTDTSYWLTGDPTSPVVTELVDRGFAVLDGIIPPGTIYRFSNNNTSTTEILLSDDRFSIFPNPAKEFVKIAIDQQDVEILALSLIDITGKQIYSASTPGHEINVSNLTPGTYFIIIQTSSGMARKMLMIK